MKVKKLFEEKKIKAGHGYYETDQYPIGGKFCRAGKEGVKIAKVLRNFPDYKGCNQEGLTDTGKKVAYNTDNIEE